MDNKNCPNCGAVYTLNDIECPYCGTLYYDLSAINFTENKPVFLKIRVPYDDTYAHITQCAIPKFNGFDVSTESRECTDCMGRVINRIYTNKMATTNVQFVAIPYGKEGRLIDVNVENS